LGQGDRIGQGHEKEKDMKDAYTEVNSIIDDFYNNIKALLTLLINHVTIFLMEVDNGK
jgi:hypothetical protein